MEENPSNKSYSTGNINFGSDKLRLFFINHLSRIHSAKLHLITKLPVLAAEVSFRDLKFAIEETVDDVGKQLARIEMIFAMLDTAATPESYLGVAGLVDDMFDAIAKTDDPELRDLSIVFYLQNIGSVEISSFQVLQMAAVKLKHKQISQLLKENCTEAKEDRTLMLLIAAKYITAK